MVAMPFSKPEAKKDGSEPGTNPPVTIGNTPKSTRSRSPKGLTQAFHLPLPKAGADTAGWALVVRPSRQTAAQGPGPRGMV